MSVIMPVFNGASHVEDAVLSILGQTFGDFEFIIIDDGSTDGAGEILARLAAGDSRIVLMRRENRGIVASLNEGLARARAPLIARMDADDVASPQRLELQARAFARRPSLVLLGGQARMIDGDGRPRRRLLMPVGAERVRATLLRTCPFIHPAVMFRRRTALDIGGYRAAFADAEDYDLWLRMSEMGEIDNLDAVLIHHRRHEASISARRFESQALATALALGMHLMRQRGAAAHEPPRPCRSLADVEALLDGDPETAFAVRLAYHRSLIYAGAIVRDEVRRATMSYLSSLRVGDLGPRQRWMVAGMIVRAAMHLLRRGRPRAALAVMGWGLRRIPAASTGAWMSAVLRRGWRVVRARTFRSLGGLS